MPNPARRPETQASVACAISAEEKRLFLDQATANAPALPRGTRWLEPQGDEDDFIAAAPEVLLTSWATRALPASWLESTDCSLRYVCHLNGSVRHLVPRSFIERGGIVSNWSDIPARTVAEHALLLALGSLRNQGEWPQVVERAGEVLHPVERLKTQSLFGQRVGIHGFGRVARALVDLLRPFKVEIRAYSEAVPEALMTEQGVVRAPSLTALFAQSDVLFECESLTPKTTQSVSAPLLAALPDGAVFVNIGRGGLVDETALLQEVRIRRIRAALDVLTQEPISAASPFHGLGNVLLSPHIAGPTFDQYPQVADFALRNIDRYLRGEALLGRVSLEDYDRAT